MGSTLLCEMFVDTSHQHIRRALPGPIASDLRVFAMLPRSPLPRSGYRGSDLVLWHYAESLGAATTSSVMCGSRDAASNDTPWSLMDASSLSATHDWAHYVRRDTARVRDH